MLMQASALPLKPFRRGKVRDVYEVDAERLLLVATDRVSAFDVVMGETIPRKGAVLTQITAWWLRQLEDKVEHHMLSASTAEIVREVPQLRDHEQELEGRAMLCRRTTVFPVECVVRGYLSGSAWKEYREAGTLAGEALGKGLSESDRLDPPIFSPATKAERLIVQRRSSVTITSSESGAARKSSISMRMSVASRKRLLMSFRKHRRSNVRMLPGVAAGSASHPGSARSTAARISVAVSPEKACLPVSSS